MCATPNRCIVMQLEPSRLISQKLAAKLELLIVTVNNSFFSVVAYNIFSRVIFFGRQNCDSFKVFWYS